MSDIKMNTAWDDILIEGNDLQVTTGQKAILQHLIQRLRTFLAEHFLDDTIGLPYFQHILKSNPDPVIVDSVFKAEIIDTPGMIELTKFDMELDSRTRELTLDFKAITTEGVISFTGVVP